MKSLIENAKVSLVTVTGTFLYEMNTVMAQSGFLSATDNPSKVAEATGGEGSLRSLILTIVNFFLGFLGLVAVLMIIFGGVLVLTSAGNPENAGKGKKILMYAAVGIIIILLSFAFVQTILGAATGQEG